MDGMDIEPDLSLCVAPSGDSSRLTGFLDSLAPFTEAAAVEVIIVVAQANDFLQELQRLHQPWLTLYDCGAAGHAAAALNHALNIARGRYLSLWSETIRFTPHSLTRLLAFLDDHPETGLAGPRIINLAGDTLPSAGPLPGLPAMLAYHSGWSGGLPGDRVPKKKTAGPLEVEWLRDAGLIIRREAFAEIGALDGEFISLYADADYCRRARHRGWHLHCLTDAVIVEHDDAVCRHGTAAERKPRHHWGDMGRYCIKKWLGL